MDQQKNEKLTRDEVVLEQLVDPLRWHHQAPLPVLKVLLTLVSSLAGLLYHHLHLVGMEGVQHLKEEVAFGKLVVIVRKV